MDERRQLQDLKHVLPVGGARAVAAEADVHAGGEILADWGDARAQAEVRRRVVHDRRAGLRLGWELGGDARRRGEAGSENASSLASGAGAGKRELKSMQ